MSLLGEGEEVENGDKVWFTAKLYTRSGGSNWVNLKSMRDDVVVPDVVCIC
jgi:hypothetical protein